MRPHSKELAYRIDILVAFQNEEDIQYRSKKAASKKWHGSPSCNLSFDFKAIEYRLKPPSPQEGWVRPHDIHTRVPRCATEPCVRMREIEEPDNA